MAKYDPEKCRLAGEDEVICGANKMDSIDVVSSIVVQRQDLSEPKASYADSSRRMRHSANTCEYSSKCGFRTLTLWSAMMCELRLPRHKTP